MTLSTSENKCDPPEKWCAIKTTSVCLKLELKSTVNLPLLIPLSKNLLIPSNI